MRATIILVPALAILGACGGPSNQSDLSGTWILKTVDGHGLPNQNVLNTPPDYHGPVDIVNFVSGTAEIDQSKITLKFTIQFSGVQNGQSVLLPPVTAIEIFTYQTSGTTITVHEFADDQSGNTIPHDVTGTFGAASLTFPWSQSVHCDCGSSPTGETAVTDFIWGFVHQ